MDFTNREIASYLWLGGFLGFMVLWQRDVRQSLIGLYQALAQPKLLTLLGSAAIYMTLWVFLFAWIGLWTSENLKATILWALSFVIVTLVEITKVKNAKEERAFFVKLLRDTFAVTGILTFILELHSFSLIIELATFPLLTFIYLLHSVAETDPRATSTRKLLSITLTGGVAWLFLYSLYMTLSDIPKVVSVGTLRELGTPILLSLVFLPFLYVYLLLVTYENTFIILQWQIPDVKLRQEAKWEALLRFGPRLPLLRKWIANVARSRPANARELRRSFNETVTAAKYATSPPFIKPSEGWSPYRAKAFLEHHELATSDYHRSFKDEWFASSSYLDLGNSLRLCNNLAYYITGNQRAATTLKLHLNVNQPEQCKAAEARFIEVGRALLEASLGLPAAEPAVRALSALQPGEIRIETKIIRLTREVWVDGIPDGYRWSVEIKHES